MKLCIEIEKRLTETDKPTTGDQFVVDEYGIAWKGGEKENYSKFHCQGPSRLRSVTGTYSGSFIEIDDISAVMTYLDQAYDLGVVMECIDNFFSEALLEAVDDSETE